MDKIAIVLFNLGGPDKLKSIQPFLFNLFNDKAIIRLPSIPRWLLANLISRSRKKTASEIYAYLGGKSPILDYTQEQALSLEKKLYQKYKYCAKVFICMRYWHPMAKEVVDDIKTFQPSQVVLLPLYPQFSTTTTGSSFDDWDERMKEAGLNISTSRVCCYPTLPGLVTAHSDLIGPIYKRAMQQGEPRILFSAHGLPENIVKGGDPYQYQINETARAIVNEMNIKNLDWVVCYQSKVGPLEWLKPSTQDEIRRAGKENIPVIVVPIAFVSEHSETLVELDIEYLEYAKEVGVKKYFRVPAICAHEQYISALSSLVSTALNQSKIGCFSQRKEPCPGKFMQCPLHVK